MENSEKFNEEEWLKNYPVQTENIAFNPEQLIACGECQRNNPPNRLKCLYCGGELELSISDEAQIKLNLRNPESWEKGFNLIFCPRKPETTAFAEIAGLVNLEKEFVRKIVEAGKYLPLVRGENLKEIEIVKNNLQRLGLETIIVSDESLSPEKMPVRLRGLEFWEDKLVLIFFNNDEIAEISRDELVLMVAGAVFENKTESVVKKKKGESEIVDATETVSDEFLLDLYTRENPHGCRIFTKGFDFSCLETEKGILAAENLKKLTKKLIEFAPDAKFVNDYLSVRETLGNIWEIEQRKDSQGLNRRGFGKFNFSKVALSNNLQQFNKYSRLQRHIL